MSEDRIEHPEPWDWAIVIKQGEQHGPYDPPAPVLCGDWWSDGARCGYCGNHWMLELDEEWVSCPCTMMKITPPDDMQSAEDEQVKPKQEEKTLG